MECEKKNLGVYRQGRVVMDQFYIDDDYNVPDARSDVREVIMGEGTLTGMEMKLLENYIRVSGRLEFRILYVADEGEQRISSLEGRIPFEEMIYMEETPQENLFIKSAQTEITVNMIHSRKLNVKALAELQVCSDGKEEVGITTDITSDIPVYKKFMTRDILGLQTVKKDTYRIKEEITVGGTKESIGSLLWTEVLGRRLDTRLEQDVLKIQGELMLFCFYESLEGKADWIEQVVPYEGQIECYGVTDDMYHQIYSNLSDINIDARMDEDGEMRLIGLEATLEIRLLVCEEQRMDVLEDVYSLARKCMPKRQERMVERLLMQNHSKCKIAENLSLPEIKDDILQICHSSARIQMEHTEAEDGGIRIEGVLHISFLYVKPDDQVPFDVWQGMVPFSYLLESNEVAEDMTYDITCQVEQLGISLLGNGEIEVKAVLAFNSFLRLPEMIQNIDEIASEPVDMEELEKGPGIIGYLVKEGDDLWSLAKRYNTTKEGIMEVNQMDFEEIKCGDKLLIFKENASIL